MSFAGVLDKMSIQAAHLGQRANNPKFKGKITLFNCFNALRDTSFLEGGQYEIQGIKMACSSMTREVFLLRAFESGADAVAVIVCPVGACRFGEGNIRARKRVERMKKLLDEIGIGGRRLNIHNIAHGDEAAVRAIVKMIEADLVELGPNPAA
jgi:F420-non-reducing hydrogenase iron-sulfur subunit